MTGRPILTAAEMRDAERASGVAPAVLMERAGDALATVCHRLSGGAPTLLLCGSGNNGGDGYVAARLLRARGVEVRVAAARPPAGEGPAAAAAARWEGPVHDPRDVEPAFVFVDALFGTGLSRPLDGADQAVLRRLAGAARIRIAADLPSGVAADDGALPSDPPAMHATVAFGALKPAHLLQPGAARCGRLVVADIGVGIDAPAMLVEVARPAALRPGPSDHKFSRGMVAVVGGTMAGAAALAAEAAARAGAGYVLLLSPDGESGSGGSHAIVRRTVDGAALADALADRRIGAVLVGPGLGRDAAARARLDVAIGSGAALVADGDALRLLDPDRPRATILTPHEGEFAHMFGTLPGSKVDRARRAAARSGAVVLLKGADSVVAAPDGRAAILPPAPAWLATAGSGDVLAGIVAARLAAGEPPFDAAAGAAWLHAEAARRSGEGIIADDLPARLAGAAG